LQICANHSDVLFITGGLGPTSDDFTREVVAEWTQKKLVWDEKSWKHVSERLTSRGFNVQEIQKQQCYFPEGAQILTNPHGTANAFTMQYQGKKIFVLPGPPREIEALWQEGVGPWLEKETVAIDRHITVSWDTIGFGESDVARLAEEALKGSHFEIGYRVHLPYVEVKVSYLKSQQTEAQLWLQKLEQALSPITALRNGEDPALQLAKLLADKKSVSIYDGVGGGFLLSRLEPHLRPQLNKNHFQFQNFSPPLGLVPQAEGLILYTHRQEENRVRVGFIERGQIRETYFESPILSPLMAERRQQYFSEIALLFWRSQLQDL
jgi:nicotinamide-nucleotide amidase